MRGIRWWQPGIKPVGRCWGRGRRGCPRLTAETATAETQPSPTARINTEKRK